jgi:hypothetical protein
MGAMATLVMVTVVAACSSRNFPDGLGSTSDLDSGSVDLCATPNTGCPCSSEGQQVACGKVVSKSGDYVSCSEGTRTCTNGSWGDCIGQYNTITSGSAAPVGGDIHTLGLSLPSADSGPCATNPCDPSCMGYGGDNSYGIDAAGLAPTADGGWTLPLGEGGAACIGLQCQVPICGSGKTTTVTGTVFDPAALNPVFNAIVMIPNGPVQPIPAGVSSDPCGGAPLPLAVTYAYSDTSGNFTLTNVPVGASIPLVIQIGRWRRVTTINTSTLTCGGSINLSASGCNGLNNYGTAPSGGSWACPTRLPRIQSEGNIPQTAIATGGLDAIECMMYRIGVSQSEFTDELHAGRMHIYNDGGSTLGAPNVNHDLSYLLGFTCPQNNCQQLANTTGITNPDFETGNLNGWTTTGSVSASTNNPYSGSYSALMGKTGSSNTGTQTLAQTFTAPAGATGLQFYVYPSCSQSSTVDYFGVTLKDNTANTTVVWGNACNNNGNWITYTAGGIVPGHSYTLTAKNYDGDGHHNYTYVDDFSWLPIPTPPNLTTNYDLIMLPCDGGNEYGAGNWGGDPYDDPGRQNLVNYANAGGRVFTSHWGREWIERTTTALPNGPFPNVATWIGDVSPCGGCSSGANGVINSGAAWGSSFNTWMTNVGAATGGTFPINPWREDTSSVSSASRLFVTYDGSNSTTSGYPADFTFDTPLGGGTKAGRVMYTDMHLANGDPSGTFPSNCPTQGSALLQQEDAAEYLLFDLSGCVSGSPLPGPPKYTPATFTRDFQGVCPTGYRVVWRNFYWEDYTPSDTNIAFTAWTADSEAQLGTQYPAAPLATASGPDNCPIADAAAVGPSCMSAFVGVGVDPKLVASGTPAWGSPAYGSHSWLRVNMTLNPSTDLLSAPTLIAWQQTYDCLASE